MQAVLIFGEKNPRHLGSAAEISEAHLYNQLFQASQACQQFDVVVVKSNKVDKLQPLNGIHVANVGDAFVAQFMTKNNIQVSKLRKILQELQALLLI